MGRPVKSADTVSDSTPTATTPAGNAAGAAPKSGPADFGAMRQEVHAKSNNSDAANTEDQSESSRRARLDELQSQCGLSLEEPVIGFLLTQSSATDVFDYLQAYHGDGEPVRRFVEGFAQRRLAAPQHAEISKASTAQDSKSPKDASNEASTAKANRRRRGKGK